MGFVERTIVRKGEEMFSITMRRVPRGIEAKIKAHPSFEEFIKGLSDGNKLDVPPAINGDSRRQWEVVRAEGEMNYIWSLPDVNIGHTGPQRTSKPFRMDRWGYDLLLEGSMPNLTFLRLCDISGEQGKTLIIRGVYSKELLMQYVEALHEAAKCLYQQFIRPLNVELTISVQEL